ARKTPVSRGESRSVGAMNAAATTTPPSAAGDLQLRPPATSGRASVGLVLERDADPGSVKRDVAVLDREVELLDLAHPKVSHRARGRLDRVLRSVLPRLRAGADHLGDPVDAVCHDSPSPSRRLAAT